MFRVGVVPKLGPMEMTALAWLCVAVILLVAGLATGGLRVVLAPTVSAVGAAAATAWGVGAAGVAGVFWVVSFASVAVAGRRVFGDVRGLGAGEDVSTGGDLRGAEGVVVELVDGVGGRVRVRRNVWDARLFDPHMASLSSGVKVYVVHADDDGLLVVPQDISLYGAEGTRGLVSTPVQ